MYSSGQPVSWLIQSTMVSDMKEQVPWIQFLHTYHKIVILHYDLSQYQGVSVSQRQHGLEVLSAEYFYLSYLSQTRNLACCLCWHSGFVMSRLWIRQTIIKSTLLFELIKTNGSLRVSLRLSSSWTQNLSTTSKGWRVPPGSIPTTPKSSTSKLAWTNMFKLEEAKAWGENIESSWLGSWTGVKSSMETWLLRKLRASGFWKPYP